MEIIMADKKCMCCGQVVRVPSATAHEFICGVCAQHNYAETMTSSECNSTITASHCNWNEMEKMPLSVLRETVVGLERTLLQPGHAPRLADTRALLLVFAGHPVLFRTGQRQYAGGRLEDVDFGYFHRVAARLIGLLVNAGGVDSREYLIDYFERQVEARLLRQMVDNLNRFISYRLDHPSPVLARQPKMSYHDDFGLRNACRLLQIIFNANRRRPFATLDSNNNRLEVGEFYNLRLDAFDIGHDFATWIHCQQQQFMPTMRQAFTFCAYPIVLSLGIKMALLEYEGESQKDAQAFHALSNMLFASSLSSRTLGGGRQPSVIEMPFLIIRIRRSHLIHDSLRELHRHTTGAGSGSAEFKKRLKIEFVGEDGVDAGGLTKEWFLLLVREVFSSDYGMFVGGYHQHASLDAVDDGLDDEERKLGYVWFNPASAGPANTGTDGSMLEEYYLVGVLMGLAIYNQTLLDIRFPSVVYKKLLHGHTLNNHDHGVSHEADDNDLTLDDLAQFRPSLARGLGDLLSFSGDVEQTYCRDFTASYKSYGHNVTVPLMQNGDQVPVTNANRAEFVRRYVSWYLGQSVESGFDAFKRGFWTVLGSGSSHRSESSAPKRIDNHAISLFDPSELESLIRGAPDSSELDLSSLRAITEYDNCSSSTPVVEWFWAYWETRGDEMKRRVLMFVTGSDRVPSVGMAGMKFKISLDTAPHPGDTPHDPPPLQQQHQHMFGLLSGGGGRSSGSSSREVEDTNRLPIAHTCFNQLVLYPYATKEKFERLMEMAVLGS